jgi:DNA invertase Pin-like site-specific DNA recombinase
METAKSFVAYLRVSTDKQGADGNGIDALSDSVARFVADTGGTLLATYVEVESAAKHNLKNRPQLQPALAHAKRSKSVLLIARLDSLSRSVLVTSQLLAANVEFVAVDFPQANRLTIQLMAVWPSTSRDSSASPRGLRWRLQRLAVLGSVLPRRR